MKRIVPLVVVLYMLLAGGQLLAQLDRFNSNNIDKIFEAYDGPSPGVAVGWYQNSELRFSKCYGVANLEDNIPISDSSVFSIASVSKQFTAFAVMLLQKQGKLSLDDDIRLYLEDFPDYGKVITIRMLANHTSGIKGHLHLLGQSGYSVENVITADMVRDVIYRQRSLNFEPGSQFSYSNSGYFLMARIVESITGKTFPQFLKESVFDPLGMNHTFVMDDFQRVVINRARSYQFDGMQYVNVPANYSYYGSTNVYTTLRDLIKWGRNYSELTVGDKDIYQMMSTPAKFGDEQLSNYGLGLMRGDFKEVDCIYHSGGDAGYRAYLAHFPSEDAFVVLLSNNASVNAEAKALEVADIFLETPARSNKVIKPISEPSPNLPHVTSEDLAQNMRFAGDYIDHNSHIVRQLILRDGKLVYLRPEQDNRETQLYALSDSSYQLGANSDIVVSFEDGPPHIMRISKDDQVLEEYHPYQPIVYSADQLENYIGIYHSRDLDVKYEVLVKGRQLAIYHPKMGEIALTPLHQDYFLSSGWQFRSVRFTRAEHSAQPKTFFISSDRAQNVRFDKVKE